MSFNVILERNRSEKIHFDKDIETIATVEGTLKDGTSIIKPVIIIERGDLYVWSVNYLSIPSFQRSYFVNDIVSIRNNLLELHCHVDVLCSFKDTLIGLDAIIKRQKNVYNLLLNDGSIHAYQNPYIITKAFPNSFTDACHVLIVAGAARATGVIITTQPVDCEISDWGDTATFTVVADGNNLTYQWQRSISQGPWRTWVDISGATSATYSFVTASTDINYVFRCKVTSDYGTSEYSDEVYVRIA